MRKPLLHYQNKNYQNESKREPGLVVNPTPTFFILITTIFPALMARGFQNTAAKNQEAYSKPFSCFTGMIPTLPGSTGLKPSGHSHSITIPTRLLRSLFLPLANCCCDSTFEPCRKRAQCPVAGKSYKGHRPPDLHIFPFPDHNGRFWLVQRLARHPHQRIGSF